MWITDTSVKRPVLATVFCALLVAAGVISFDRLPLREFPDIEPAVVSVSANYPGASAAVVENKITEVVEDQIAGVEGIKSVSSVSQDGRSVITIEFRLGRPTAGLRLRRRAASQRRGPVRLRPAGFR